VGSVSYYARPGPSGTLADGQLLRDHLACVGGLAQRLARESQPVQPTDVEPLRAERNRFHSAALWAGLLHDLGKYSEDFQRLLRSRAGGDLAEYARVEHSGQGSAYAFKQDALDIAFAVAGHHSGLTLPRGGASSLHERVQRNAQAAETLLRLARSDGSVDGLPRLDGAPPPVPRGVDPIAFDLIVRMLASCLVDADRLDASNSTPDSAVLADATERLQRLLRYVQSLPTDRMTCAVLEVRRQVLERCLDAAVWPEKLLSLTVPTGGGKTLASLAFALRRAALHPDLVRRVIVVVPYLSIIEQNAQVYARSMGDNSVVEHHSGALGCLRDNDSPSEEERRWQAAVENWNAPVIMTTSVRFFESLFSNRPSDLRRLHNIARSVVILDEVQTLPRHLLAAILSMMRALADDWSTTFLLCTATQPAFEKHSEAPPTDPRWPKGTVREIVADPPALFARLQRVMVSWPSDRAGSRPWTWEHLAHRIADESRALCILNLKEHAAIVFEQLRRHGAVDQDHLWHLSARMCPQHRLDTLQAVMSALAKPGGPCRLVATQVVEAGVDIDFPVVFRALGPLDSLVQAAGRCDREGIATAQAGKPAGRVIVFEPDLPQGVPFTPPGAYTEATDVTRAMLSNDRLSLNDPALMRGYFNRYYQADLDERDVQPLRRQLNFPAVADRFRLIDDATDDVLVPYDDEARALLARLRNEGHPNMLLLRHLQRYRVGLRPWELRRALTTGAVYELTQGSGVWIAQENSYDRKLGLALSPAGPLMV